MSRFRQGFNNSVFVRDLRIQTFTANLFRQLLSVKWFVCVHCCAYASAHTFLHTFLKSFSCLCICVETSSLIIQAISLVLIGRAAITIFKSTKLLGSAAIMIVQRKIAALCRTRNIGIVNYFRRGISGCGRPGSDLMLLELKLALCCRWRSSSVPGCDRSKSRSYISGCDRLSYLCPED